MSMIEALRRPASEDLSAFVHLLERLGLPHRVSEERDQQVLWVPDAGLAEQVRALHARYPQGDPGGELASAPLPRRAGPDLAGQARRAPVTVLVLLACLAVAVLGQLGDDLEVLRWMNFVDFQVHGEYLRFVPLEQSLEAGEWWRPLSPMLMHFSVLHLAMNGLWYWELGRRIEARQGSRLLLLLTLAFGLLANCAQYLWAGPSLFGGLSGVLYGLLGHCWVFQMLAPNRAYQLPRGVVAMMLIWLLVCMSGVTVALGFGGIANAAHVGGLLAGCGSGLLGGLLARRR